MYEGGRISIARKMVKRGVFVVSATEWLGGAKKYRVESRISVDLCRMRERGGMIR